MSSPEHRLPGRTGSAGVDGTVAARQRAAGPHAKGQASERQAAKRALAKAKLVSED